jgi:hypothetical protein
MAGPDQEQEWGSEGYKWKPGHNQVWREELSVTIHAVNSNGDIEEDHPGKSVTRTSAAVIEMYPSDPLSSRARTTTKNLAPTLTTG